MLLAGKAMHMSPMQQTGDDGLKSAPVLAAGAALALCLAAAVAVRFRPYDPAAPAGSETILDYCLLFGVWLVPFASVCFARRLFEGSRFRFALSWLVGFLVPWLLLVYETYFPHVPPEGSYCTEAEQCLQVTAFAAIATGVINVLDSFVERMLCKSRGGCRLSRAGLQMTVFLSVLALGVFFLLMLML